MGGYQSAMRNYAWFRGRAPRIEFIGFLAVVMVLYIAALIVGTELLGGDGEVHSLFAHLVILVHILPGLAVVARRLHDLNWSGWFALVGLVPLVKFVVVLLAFPPGSRGPNRFGPDPLKRVPGPYEQHGRDNLGVAPGTAVAPVPSPIIELERLAALRASGGVSEAEFGALKRRILQGQQA